MKKNYVVLFTKKVFVFFFGLLLILLSADYIITNGLRNSEYDLYKGWNDILKSKINADLIIQGSSRAWVHISPKIIEEEFDINCYNLGSNGYRFDMQLARYKLYRKYNKKPKVILQALDIYSLKKNDLFNNNQYLPYFNEKYIIDAIKPYNFYKFYDYYVPAIKYRGIYYLMRIGFAEFFLIKHFKCNTYKGYMGVNKTWDTDFEAFLKKNPDGLVQEIDSNLVKDFEAFLYKIKKEGIRAILVYTPEYFEFQELTKNRKEIINIYKQLANKYSIRFIDFSSDPISYNKKYFYNSQHLNKFGSEIFTKKLVNDIRKEIF